MSTITMRRLFILFFIYVALPLFAVAHITYVVVRGKAGQTTNNYPLTIGQWFRQGDVPVGETVSFHLQNGQSLPTQFEPRRYYADGSCKHAVLSSIIPQINANTDTVLDLVCGGINLAGAGMSKDEILATDVECAISLVNLSSSGYIGSRTAGLRNTVIANTIGTNPNPNSSLDYWLSGSVMTEIIAREDIASDSGHSQLNAYWEVRYYPGSAFGPRISVGIENVEGNYRGNVNYGVSVSLGKSAPVAQLWDDGSTVKYVNHIFQSRWRKVWWMGQQPPEVEIRYDTNYLISSGLVMNYDTSLEVPETAISNLQSLWSGRDSDIFGEDYAAGSFQSGIVLKYFPTTGMRDELCILPRWAVMCLFSWDNRLREIVLGQAELAANAPVHWRETDPEKSFFGRVISIDDRPSVMTRADTDVSTGLPADAGVQDHQNWSIDRAHQGSFAFIPYLVTGERFYLDEMYYWAGYDLSMAATDPSWGRDYSQGLLRDQVRGEAWALRQIADAAAIAPDGEPEKDYFEEKISNNIQAWLSEEGRYPLGYWGMDTYATLDGMDTSKVKYITSPWMEDFMLLSLVHAGELGYDTGAILSWFRKFNSSRFIDPDFNPYNGASYRFPAQLVDSLCSSPPCYPESWAQARDCFLAQPSTLTALRA